MFTRNGNLKSHELIHTGVKPYACSTCGNMFKQNGDLKKHKRIHTGITSYACSTCGNMFTRHFHRPVLWFMNRCTQARDLFYMWKDVHTIIPPRHIELIHTRGTRPIV